MSTAIQFEHVSRRFVLHHHRARSFQELVIRMLQGQGNGRREVFWALSDVSFEVKKGEMVALVGANGAGKSTVLKLISRIIDPTSGRIIVNGRVGALLELGTGFHPDLTGRENIYLNGAILGLRRDEITRRLDDIIAFAEMERFIDVPVKHYSSGMYVRLGFSVAVHVEPEILLVDEVLAVGDAAFQRRCLERIDQMRANGTTIVFVSHDLNAVRRLCQRAIWLEKGCIVADGSPEAVVGEYATQSYAASAALAARRELCRHGTGEVTIEEVRFLDGEGRLRDFFSTGESFTIEMRYRAHKVIERPVFGIAIHRSDGVHVTGPNTQFAQYEIPMVRGEGVVRYTVPFLPLLEGTYYVSVSSHDRDSICMYDYHDRLYPFCVLSGAEERYGLVTLRGVWSWKEE
ncbi:MAG: ABC transporter ATP-binding protein [Ardenticatenia bacterium]|nr:MAG: ABC transporter ATP-binding protein [Ardenticatenia bacterium]